MARALEVGMPAQEVLALRDCPTTEAGLALIEKAHLGDAFLTRCTDLIAERIHKEFREYLDGESSKESPKKTLEVVISDLSGHLLRRATFAFPGGEQIMAENRAQG